MKKSMKNPFSPLFRKYIGRYFRHFFLISIYDENPGKPRFRIPFFHISPEKTGHFRIYVKFIGQKQLIAGAVGPVADRHQQGNLFFFSFIQNIASADLYISYLYAFFHLRNSSSCFPK